MGTPLFNDSSLPADLSVQVRNELRDGERLLWVGQPRPGRFARQAGCVVLFAIPWTAFAIFWMANALFPGAGGQGQGGGALDWCFALFGLPFVLIGLLLLSSPYWVIRHAKRTCYALTDRRAILRKPGLLGGIEVRSYGPAELTKLHRVDYSDGVGDLVFEEVKVGADGDGTQRHGFLAIDNVRKVEELLRKALQLGECQVEPPVTDNYDY
jgi:hypothetical protein